MQPWQNRIVGHDSADPKTLTANDKNWRVHTPEQTRALAGAIGDIGFIRSVTVNRRTGRIIDGHLRVALAIEQGQASIPVEYVDLTDAEEAEALATIDPLAELAGRDDDAFKKLLGMFDHHDEALDVILGQPGDPEPEEVKPEVEFSEYMTESSNYVVLLFDNDIDWMAAMTHFDVKTKASRLMSGKPGNKGIGRVINGAAYLKRIQDMIGHG